MVSVVWDGLRFTSKRPGSPSSLPDPCNPGLLAQRRPRSSASNKQPLINHALLITQALLSARVCEIDPVCALLRAETPCFCPSHLSRHHCQRLASPPDFLLFTLHSFLRLSSFHSSRALSSHPTMMPLLDSSRIHSVSLNLSFSAKNFSMVCVLLDHSMMKVR